MKEHFALSPTRRKAIEKTVSTLVPDFLWKITVLKMSTIAARCIPGAVGTTLRMSGRGGEVWWKVRCKWESKIYTYIQTYIHALLNVKNYLGSWKLTFAFPICFENQFEPATARMSQGNALQCFAAVSEGVNGVMAFAAYSYHFSVEITRISF